jgi:hypothetical protein
MVQSSTKQDDDDTNNSAETSLDINHNHNTVVAAAAQTAVSLQERLIKELEEALETKKAEHAEKDEFIEELREALQSQEEIMTDLQKRHRDESRDIVRFKAELWHVKKRHTTTDAENEELISDIHDVLEESNGLKQELAERDVLVELLKGDLDDMEKSKNELLEEIDKEACMEEELETVRSTLERRIKNMALEQIHLEQHMSSLNSKLNVAEDQLDSVAAEHRRYKMQAEGLANKMRTVFPKGGIREELDRIELMLIPTINVIKKEELTTAVVSQENSSALMGRMRRRASMATCSIMGGAGSSDATRRPKVKVKDKDKEIHILQSPSTVQPHQPSPKATSKVTEGTDPRRDAARRASIFGSPGSQNVSKQPERDSVSKRPDAIYRNASPMRKIESLPFVDLDFVGLDREENAKSVELTLMGSKGEVVAKGTNSPSPAAAVLTNDTAIDLALASALPNFLDAVLSTTNVEAPVEENSSKKEPHFAKIMAGEGRTQEEQEQSIIASACGTATAPDEPLGLLGLSQSNSTINQRKAPTTAQQDDEGRSIQHNAIRSVIWEPDMGVLDAFGTSSPSSRAELESQCGTAIKNLFANARERAMEQINVIKKQINTTTSPNANANTNARFTFGRPRRATTTSDGKTRIGPAITKTAVTGGDKSCKVLFRVHRNAFRGDPDDDDDDEDDSIGPSAIVSHVDVELYEGFGNKATDDDPPDLIIPHATIELYEGFASVKNMQIKIMQYRVMAGFHVYKCTIIHILYAVTQFNMHYRRSVFHEVASVFVVAIYCSYPIESQPLYNHK